MIRLLSILLTLFCVGCGGKPSRVSVTGYTDKLSYSAGETMRLYLSGKAQEGYPIRLKNLSGETVAELEVDLKPQSASGAKPYETGFGYQETARIQVPELPGGMYFWEGSIPVLIRGSGSVAVLYSTNTVEAYNEAGGRSMYSAPERARVVSFHRPRGFDRLSAGCMKQFHGRGYRYLADVDMDELEVLDGVKLLVVVGHSEYWTRQARENLDDFVGRGGHVLMLSGNSVWWQVRYSPDRSRLICYRDHALDPETDPLLETVAWNNPLLNYPALDSIGADWPNGGFGLRHNPDGGWDGFKVLEPSSPLFRGTGLQAGQVLPLPTQEYDGIPITGFDAGGNPVVDPAHAAKFHRFTVLAFDRNDKVGSVPAMVSFQKTALSGQFVNAASTDWCVDAQDMRRKVIDNAIEALVNDEAL